MSSPYTISAYTASLQLAQTYLFRYVGSIILAVGSIGCLLSWMVFGKKTLRKNPCSVYMMAFHISNFTYMVTVVLPSVLSIGYGMTFVTDTLGLCRFAMYMAFALDIVSPACLLLASIDRLLVTSPNALIRRRSTRRLAYISIICTTLFWLLFHSHALVLMHVIPIGTNVFICFTQSSVYLVAIGYYALVKSILIPSLLAILGLLAIRNIQRLGHKRVAPDASTMGTANNRRWQSVHSKDRQLVRILLIDIGIYVLCVYPQTAMSVYLQITQYNIKSFDQTQADVAIQYLCSFSGFIPYAVGLYSNSLVSKTFRKEVKSILLCK